MSWRPTPLSIGSWALYDLANTIFALGVGSLYFAAWLTDHVLDPDKEGSERTLDVHFSRIRKKLGSAAGRIATVWGVGYKLVPSK